MSDALVDAVRRARVWPAGSGARQTMLGAARQLVVKRDREIGEMEELLARQWAWLDRGDPGEAAESSNDRRYEDGLRRFLATLADYEDLIDGRTEAMREMEALAA